jgi:cyclophilin family peptidyl-prolyl cis-trans isomerase
MLPVRRRFVVLSAAVLAGTAVNVFADVDATLKKSMKDPTNPVVKISTTRGDMTVELYKKEAPKTVANFLSYVKKGHYDGTIFHRVIPTFMIQGGGYTKDLKEKPTDPPVSNESSNGLSNAVGTIAMARTPEPNSATSQFFINTSTKNQFLDKAHSTDGVGYCVFGKVIGGMDAVEQIKGVKTQQKPPLFEALPLVAVEIKSVTQLQ